VYRERDVSEIQLRLFKNIPVDGLEMLLPHTKIRMRIKDKLILGGSSGMAFGSAAFKIWVKITLFTQHLLGLTLIALAGVFFGGKTFLRYRKIRETYFGDIVRELYHQSLANNDGVLRVLADVAEEEAFEKAVLLYCFAWQTKGEEPFPDDLKQQIEQYFSDVFSVDVDFDIDDAAQRLRRLRLLKHPDSLRVFPPEETVAILDGQWDDVFSANDIAKQ
jgi:hypothetical protein